MGQTQPKVIITETLDAVCADWLAQHAQVVWCHLDQTEKLAKHLPEADALVVRTYTHVNSDLLAQAKQLKVVGRAGVGLDNIDLQACQDRGVAVVYTPDANTQAVVEYMFGLILDAVRPRYTLETACDDATFHQLRKQQVGQQLDEMTLGILGFGRIGKRLGQVTDALGMKVMVNDLLPESQLQAKVQYPFDFVDAKTLYQNSDILTVHTDGRSANRHLINRQALDLLKPDCLFVNAARGMLVDHFALAHWAQANAQGRVILDVHDPEPPTGENPLFGLPNVRLLPHLASRTHTALKNMSWVVKDVLAVLQGQSPRYLANAT